MSGFSRDYDEKRNFIRMNVSTPAQIDLPDGSQHQVQCTNLSSGGAQLESSEALSPQQQAKLTIFSGGGSTSNLIADITIIRSTALENGKYSIGVSIDQYH